MSTITIDNELSGDASVWPTAIKYGIIGAVANAVLTMLFYNVGLMELDDSGQAGSFIPTIVTTLLGIAVLFLGLKTYRDTENGGRLTVGRGALWSLAYGLIGGLVAAVFTYLFFTFLAPEFIENMAALQEAALEDSGASAEQIEQTQGMMGMFMSPGFFAITSVFSTVITSLIIGSIISIFIKTR